MLKNKILFFSILLLSFFIFAPVVHAQGFLDDAGLSVACTENGQCSLDDVAAGFLSLIRLLLGGIAALALVFMVWGGVQWVWSGGNADKVKRGKDIFFNTIAALVLAFGSFMITSFFINDILQPESQYRVSSEESEDVCNMAPFGQACNLPQANYVCTGAENNELCLTKCEATRYVPELAASLESENVAFKCDSLNNNPEGLYKSNFCPGSADNVCILFHGNGDPVTDSEALADPGLGTIMTFSNWPW